MLSPLAIHGGSPVRATLLPYGRQSVDDKDVAAVTAVLKGDWLTAGPRIGEFENAFADFVKAQDAVAVSNGTAALHAALYAVDIQPGDDVIVPAMTFASTANVVLFMGATPVFVDSQEGTLLLDPEAVEKAITPKTKAIITVDYTGQPSLYDDLRSIASKHGIPLISDACHALGATDNGRPVGSLADLNTFSFHPVKPMTTGEGGMITTHNAEYAKRMRSFRNHCLSSDHRERHVSGAWFYEVTDLGYNYRLTDIQCALGMSQLKRVEAWTARRQDIAQIYGEAFSVMDAVTPLTVRDDSTHSYHLYVVLLDHLTAGRDEIFAALRAEGIGVNVHYIPVHFHPLYRERLGTKEGLCPVAEKAYARMLTLPIFPGMTDDDISSVIEAVHKVTDYYKAS